jgi:hypothetical protein
VWVFDAPGLKRLRKKLTRMVLRNSTFPILSLPD